MKAYVVCKCFGPPYDDEIVTIVTDEQLAKKLVEKMAEHRGRIRTSHDSERYHTFELNDVSALKHMLSAPVTRSSDDE